ncbi:uncharacterized protein [Leptinotarsa decemlineata]|uniref:uncharacterized protein n=1 Tax=Leptinotarsa decemlineata TaxID=7539 RepID=UPI003D308EF5
MSGEYYCSDEPVTKFYKDYESISPSSRSKNDTYESQGQSHRLHDIEEQLEMAETRCNTLKDQLDYMKQIYGVKKEVSKSRKISNVSGTQKLSDDDLTLSSASVPSVETKVVPVRQSSNAISTDNTGAAVRTINNILNGITDSVNRLSELHVQISETPRVRVLATGSASPHHTVEDSSTKTNPVIKESEEFQVPNKSTTGISTKSKSIKRKLKESKVSAKKPPSQKSLSRNTKVDRKIKTNAAKGSIIDKTNSAVLSQRKDILNTFKIKTQEKLVEIYHNKEAKSSDSDEGNNKSREKSSKQQSTVMTAEDVPPLNIPNQKTNRLSNENVKCSSEGVRQHIDPDCYYDPPEAPRTVQSCCYRSYELPTIASKMKQVAKSYLHTFNFKAIPFCAAISTSPSHNIGINIQQVMNIIKNRHPVNGISPTLAHNIGLAAEKLNSRPLSALVSTINSKTCYRSSQCPLSKPSLNYQQLQDMAKSIPEETAEEVEEEIDSPEVRTIVITGPSGDMEVKNRVVPIWAADPTQSEQCTCINQTGNNIHHVVNKYKRNGSAMTSLTTVSHKEKRWGRFQKGNKRGTTKRPHSQCDGYIPANEETHADPLEHPLQGKEKNLKEVLTNLHNEFETLNKKYEELSQNANADDDENLTELEKLESELNKKEEEIVMVMTLYKEVLALKQQIKTLKQKTSQPSISLSDQKDCPPNFKEYNNPQAAFHLTKLLRQIQMYQMRYKKEIE